MSTHTQLPHTPREVVERFARLINAGDVEGALALYEPDALFEAQPGQTVSGREAIREALAGFAALKPTLTGEVQKVHESRGTALVINRWTLAGTAPDGSEVTMSGTSADVVRRQPEGGWRVLIDDPWGGTT